ncbi:hypothetical protein EDD86DRAFT_76672 [Gorgonomyces haynaldii]|nr:hypothetical protein EDD86DRAFT_76672 [Gorgonomyces haynaldii]
MSIVQPYYYWSTLMHGLGLYEGFACASKLLSIMEQKNYRRSSIVITSCITMLLAAIQLVGVMVILNFIYAPWDSFEAPIYYTLLNLCFYVGSIPPVTIHIIMLQRLSGIYTTRSRQFIMIFSMAVIHLILVCIRLYYISQVTMVSKFYTSPLYGTYLIISTATMIVDNVVNVIGSAFCLLAIGNVYELKAKTVFRELYYRHDGFKWLLVILLNLYSIGTMIYSLLTTAANNYITVAYHISPYLEFLTIYVFLEHKFVVPSALLERNDKSRSPSDSGTLERPSIITIT